MDDDLEFEFEPEEPGDELEGYEREADGSPKSVPAELFMIGPLADGVWLGIQVREPGSDSLTPIQMHLSAQHAILMGEMLQNAGQLVSVKGPKN